MKLKIDDIGRKAVIEIDPDDYFLVRCKEGENFAGDYALAVRIDMSYKGKDDQEGASVIYLMEHEAEKMRAIGITEVL